MNDEPATIDDELTPEERAEALWLDSDDEDAPPPWSPLHAIAQLLVALLVVSLLLAALLLLLAVASWIFR